MSETRSDNKYEVTMKEVNIADPEVNIEFDIVDINGAALPSDVTISVHAELIWEKDQPHRDTPHYTTETKTFTTDGSTKSYSATLNFEDADYAEGQPFDYTLKLTFSDGAGEIDFSGSATSQA